MKKIIVSSLLLLLTFSFLKAQSNYSFINPNSINYYDGENTWAQAFSVDQIIASDSGTVYFPKTIYGMMNRNYESYPRGYCDVNTSFFGDSIFIDNSGDGYFYTHRDFVFVFKNIVNVDFDPWIMYSEDNGAYIEAQYTGLQNQEVLGENIVLAIMELSVFDSLGNALEEHPCHQMTLSVSPTYGFVNVFDFNNFNGIYIHEDDPLSIKAFVLNGMESDGEIIGEDHLIRTLFKRTLGSVEPGTIVHFTYRESRDYEVKREYLKTSMDDDKFYYTYRDSIKFSYSGNDSIISEIKTSSFDYDREYNEFLFDSITGYFLGFWNYSIYYGFDYRNTIGYTYWHTSGVEGDGVDISDSERTSITPGYLYGMGDHSSNRFIEGLGHFESRYSEGGNSSDLIVYYKIDDWQEWGTPLGFNSSDPNGINNLLQEAIETQPNPFKDQLVIQLLNNDFYRLNIYNIQGQKVYSKSISNYESDQLRLNLGFLDIGIYFVELVDNNNASVRQKIIKH